MNVDCPREQYVVQGLHVIRTDVRGTQHFSLHWDPHRQQLQWGTHGRLFLEWIGDNAIAWVPDAHNARVWRWQRTGPAPPRQMTQLGVSSSASSAYGPLRHSRAGQLWESHPYSIGPSGQSNTGGSGTGVGGNGRSWGWDQPGGDRRHHRHREHEHRDRHRDHRSGRSRAFVGGTTANSRLPCGLTSVEVFDLLSRDITPDDYDLLLRLDEVVAKPTASSETLECLPVVAAEEFMGGSCTVCLSPFEKEDEVTALPCKHHFHRNCITRWLAECRRACPLCGSEALPS